MKKNILIMFDCYGVVSSCALLPYFISHFGEEKGREYNAHYSKLGDMGDITLRVMAIEMSRITGEDHNDIYDYWIENTVVEPRMKKLLAYLKEKYYVVLASNAMEGIVEDTFKKHELEPYFDKVFVSYKYKDIKPNLSYYYRIINSFDVKFEKIVMVDDYAPNIAPLKDEGIIGILFTDFDSLVIELEKTLLEPIIID